MSFLSFQCHSIHSGVVLFILMSFHSFRCHSFHSNVIPFILMSFHQSELILTLFHHSGVIPLILISFRHSEVIPFIPLSFHPPPIGSEWYCPPLFIFYHPAVISVIRLSFHHFYIIPASFQIIPWTLHGPAQKSGDFSCKRKFIPSHPGMTTEWGYFVIRRSFQVRMTSNDRDEGWEVRSRLIIIPFKMTLEWLFFVIPTSSCHSRRRMNETK